MSEEQQQQNISDGEEDAEESQIDHLINNDCDVRKNLFDEFDVPSKQKSSSESSGREYMKVYLRIRPFSKVEIEAKEDQNCVERESDTAVLANAPKESFTFKNGTRAGGEVSHRFTFSNVFSEGTTQKAFFDETTLPLVTDFIHGQNCLVFTYGVTNSGKTYTIQGTPKDGGILPRSLDVLFNSIHGKQYDRMNLKPRFYADVTRLQEVTEQKELAFKNALLSSLNKETFDINAFLQLDPDSFGESDVSKMHSCADESSLHNTLKTQAGNQEGDTTEAEEEISRIADDTTINVDAQGPVKFAVWVSFAEIYNEVIFDLLEPCPMGKGKKRTTLRLGDDLNGNPYIKGLREICVSNADDAYKILKIGQKNQRIASTKLNQCSSRSHCIFNVKVLRVVDVAEPHVARVSRLSFVDLAGSERYSKTQSKGDRLKEAGNINNSLMTLGKCLEYLRHNQKNPNQPLIIPFRESKLTRLFQGFFCGRGRASMIVNVNMCASLFDETFHVLKFSAIAKKVTTKVSKPVDLPPPAKKTQVSAPTPPSKIARLSVPWVNGGICTPALASDGPLTEQEEGEEEESGNFEGSCYQQQLVDLVKVLQEKLIEEKRKVRTLEVKIREEVCKEMAEQLVAIETAYSERVKMEVTAVEEKCDRRIELLTQSIKKTRKRARTERVEEDEEEWVPSVFLHAEQIKVQEKEHIVKDLNAKIAALRQEVKQYQDSRKKEVEKSEVVLELQSHLNDANEQVSELKQMLERAGEALVEKDVHIQKLRATLDEEEICTKKQDAALKEVTERLEAKSAADTADMERVNVALEGAMSKLAEAERKLEMKESLLTELVRTLEETREELAREKSFVTQASDNEEHMIRLKDELQAMRAQNEALEKDLSSKEETIDFLRKLTEQEKAQLLEKASQISDAEGKITSKETELERVKKELDMMSCRLNNAEEKIAVNVSEMERIKVDASEKERQLHLARNELREKQQKLDLAEREISQKTTDLDNAKREVSKKDKELQNAKEEAYNKDSDFKKTEVKLCEMKEAVEIAKCGSHGKTDFSAQEHRIQISEITDNKEEILPQASKIKELETAVREKSDELGVVKHESEQKIGQLETELKECMEQIRKLESDGSFKELERQLEESTKALDKKNSQVITKNNAIKRLEISLAEKERQLADMEKLPKEPNLRAKEELKTLRRRVMQADREVKDLIAAKEEALNELAAAQKDSRDAQASLEEAKEDIKKKEETAQSLQQQLHSLSSRNACLEGELDSAKKASQNKEKAAQEAKEDLLAVKRTSDSELAEMKERLIFSEGKVQELEDEVFAANEKISQFQDDVQRYQKETVPELKDTVKILQQELTCRDDRLKEAEAKLQNTARESRAQSERRNKEMEQKAKEVIKLKEDLKSLDEEKCRELDKVWQELVSMQKTIEERNKTIDDLESKLSASAREQNTCKEEIKSLTVEFKTVQEQKRTLESRLEAMTTNLDLVKSDAGKEKETSVNLKQVLEEQDRVLFEQAQALDERQSEIETLITEIETWKDKCSLTSKNLDKKKLEITDLQRQASAASEEKERLETQLKELTSQQQATETDASSRIEKVQEEMQTLRRNKCTLEEQLRQKDDEIQKVNESKDGIMKTMREAFEIAKAKKAECEVKLSTVKEQCEKDARKNMEEKLRRARRDFQRQLKEKDRIIEEMKSGKEAVAENEKRNNSDATDTVNNKQEPGAGTDVAGNSESSSSSEASTALPQSNKKKQLKRHSSDLTLAELKNQLSASKTDKADSDEEFTSDSIRKTTRTQSSRKKAGRANPCRLSKLKTSAKADVLPTTEESPFKNDQGTKRRKLFGDIKENNHNSEDEGVKQLAQPNEGRENIPPKALPSSTKKKRLLSLKTTALSSSLLPRTKVMCNEEKPESVPATAIILKQLRTRTIKHN